MWSLLKLVQLTITSTGRIGAIGLPASLHKAMITAAADKAMVITAAAAVSLDKATSGLSTAQQSRPRARSQSRAGRSSSRPPLRKPPKEPAKAAPKADAYQHMYRGQGARAKRIARRLLLQAGLEVPQSLKPGKAVNDLPEPEKAEAKALQKRLKELRFSRQYSTCEVENEVNQIKGRLHELLGPTEEEEEEDEQETTDQANKRLLETIKEAKEVTEQCKKAVKKELEEATPPLAEQAPAAKPAEATEGGEPAEATAATAVPEPEKANDMPTGNTKENEEEGDWQKVGGSKKKKRTKKDKKNP